MTSLRSMFMSRAGPLFAFLSFAGGVRHARANTFNLDQRVRKSFLDSAIRQGTASFAGMVSAAKTSITSPFGRRRSTHVGDEIGFGTSRQGASKADMVRTVLSSIFGRRRSTGAGVEIGLGTSLLRAPKLAVA